MKYSHVKLVWIFVVISSTFLPAVSLNQERVYAQDSSGTTNATALSGDDASSQSGQLQNQSINYFDGSLGYLVYPSSANTTGTSAGQQQQQQKLPAVVMVHEWWGLNDNIKDMADELASEGYVVLAADLYNGEVAADPNRARELSSSVRENPQQAISNLQSAVQYLTSLPNVNSSRIAALGWCFGGGQALQLALNSEQHPLAATVIYYGNLVNDTNELSKINWPVLGIFGDQDQAVPVESVNAFEQALNETGITNEIYLYPGVGHAFANPSGDNYAPEETADAWEKTLVFLKKYV
ncbi:MAG: dienelactone hydrolase family protein [Thermoproteota archaeon]|nr:dienelactone hydrolase family protein [Thermoproteota archaeon]